MSEQEKVIYEAVARLLRDMELPFVVCVTGSVSFRDENGKLRTHVQTQTN